MSRLCLPLSTFGEIQLKLEIDQHWLKKLPVGDSRTSYCYLLWSQHYHIASITVHTVSYMFWVHKPPLTIFFFFLVYMLQSSHNQPGLFGPCRSCLTSYNSPNSHVVHKTNDCKTPDYETERCEKAIPGFLRSCGAATAWVNWWTTSCCDSESESRFPPWLARNGAI